MVVQLLVGERRFRKEEKDKELTEAEEGKEKAGGGFYPVTWTGTFGE